MIRSSGSRRRTPIREYWREVADSLVRLSRAARNAAETFDMRRMQTVATHVLNLRKLSGKLEIELGRTVSTHYNLNAGFESTRFLKALRAKLAVSGRQWTVHRNWAR
jgi:hypothetical protein